jgi:flagellar hook-associated protein 3 FlgL
MRVATLHTSLAQVDAITSRQAEQAQLQSRITSGLRVQTPGDDPAAAAQAELARSRLAHLQQDQRATQMATSLLGTADGALSHGVDLLQSAREALVAAADGAYSSTDRKALAQTLRATREQLLQVANSGDGAGGYVFGGQGTTAAPFSGASAPAFGAAAGVQRIGEQAGYAASVDGRAVFVDVPQGNGVFVTAAGSGNTGAAWIDTGTVADATQLTGHAYSITFGGTSAAPTYTVLDTTSGAAVASNQPYTSGGPITIAGQRVSVSGTPAAGDSFTLAPAGRQSIFSTLDQAIGLLEGSPTPAAYNQGLAQVQAGLDRALDGFNLARAHVGEQMRAVQSHADGNDQETLAVTTRRSGLEDLDLAQAISQLQAGQTASQAALQVYSAVSRKSLFDLLG